MAIFFHFTPNNPDHDLPETSIAFKGLIEIFNSKTYGAQQTGLSYRQINYINTNLLDDNRTKKNGWRKFSFKEILYLSIVKELRNFGLKDKQLMNLKKAFFSKKYKKFSDKALYLVWREFNVYLLIDDKFDVDFYYANEALGDTLRPKMKIFIDIDFNNFFHTTWNKIGLKPIEYKNINELFNDNIIRSKAETMISLLESKGYKEFTGRPIFENGKENIIITGTKRKVATMEEIKKLMNEDYTKVIKQKKVANNKHKILIEKSHKI